MLWTDGSVPFPFGKDGSGVLANCSLCGTKATLFFSADLVCSSFSAEACTILHALCGSTNKSSISLLFSYLTLATLSSPTLLSGYNGSPDTRFSRRTTQLMSWPDGERYLFPEQSLVVSLLLSTLVFSRTGGVLFHPNSLTPRFPRFPQGNLCFYVTLAVFSLTFAVTDTVFC